MTNNSSQTYNVTALRSAAFRNAKQSANGADRAQLRMAVSMAYGFLHGIDADGERFPFNPIRLLQPDNKSHVARGLVWYGFKYEEEKDGVGTGRYLWNEDVTESMKRNVAQILKNGAVLGAALVKANQEMGCRIKYNDEKQVLHVPNVLLYTEEEIAKDDIDRDALNPMKSFAKTAKHARRYLGFVKSGANETQSNRPSNAKEAAAIVEQISNYLNACGMPARGSDLHKQIIALTAWLDNHVNAKDVEQYEREFGPNADTDATNAA